MACGRIGYEHSALLDSNGYLWTVGRGQSGQLGHENYESLLALERVGSIPPCVAVSTGVSFTACVTGSGEVYCFGSITKKLQDRNGHWDKTARHTPQRVEGLPPIRTLMCGHYHVVCVGEDDSVWSFGENAEGQLGLGHREYGNQPCQIPNVSAQQVACGREHTLILTREGQLYGCGKGTSGPSEASRSLVPTLIPLAFKAKFLDGGDRFSIIQAQDGMLWSSGINDEGQLGLKDRIRRFGFTPIPDLVATQVVCGYHHALAIDDKEQLWGWGYNGYDQLSPSEAQSVSPPTLLLQGVASVISGLSHTVILTTKDQVLACGWGNHGQLANGQLCRSSNWTTTAIQADMVRKGPIELRRLKSARSIMEEVGIGIGEDFE